MRYIIMFLVLLLFDSSAKTQSWAHSGKVGIVDGDPGHAAAMKIVMLRNFRQLLPESLVPQVDIIPTFFPDSAQLVDYAVLSYSHTNCCTSDNVYNYANHNQLTMASHGSNQHVLVEKNPLWPWVRSGTHDSIGINKRTSYGPGLDFILLTDTIIGYQSRRPYETAASESFANVLAVTKFYYIKHVRDSLCGCDETWFNVYEAVKRTASNYNPILQKNGRVLKTGWGKINMNAAIAYNGPYETDYWDTSDYEWGDMYTTPRTLIDSFPKKTVLTGWELLKTYREEDGGNVEYTTETIKNYVLKNHRNGVVTGTTDGIGDLLITFPSMPDITYTLIAQNEGATPYIFSTQPATKATGSVKIRVFDANGIPVTATSVTISYQIQDY